MPISDCQVRDPRVRRTRQLLQVALQIRLRSQNFDEITVQEIANTATLNRATFYDHYTDKFALLDATIAGGFLALVAERNLVYDGTCPSAATAIILAACDYLTQTQKDYTVCHRQGAFEPLLDAAMTNAICGILARGFQTVSPLSHPPPDMAAAIAGWALYGAIKIWFKTPDHCSSEEIAPPILKIILPLLNHGG